MRAAGIAHIFIFAIVVEKSAQIDCVGHALIEKMGSSRNSRTGVDFTGARTRSICGYRT
jgi:hypothetical protein